MKKISKFLNLSFFIWGISAIVINLIVECICRGSLIQGINFFSDKSKVFLYNTIVIMVSTMWIFLVKKRYAGLVVTNIIWIIAAVTSSFLVKFRGSPLTGTDLTMISQAISIAGEYLNLQTVAIIIVGISSAIGVIIAVFKCDKGINKVNYKLVIPIMVIGIIIFPKVTVYVQNKGIVSKYFADLFYSYREYGFAYSFINTISNNGIEKPESYCEEDIDIILNECTFENEIALGNYNLIEAFNSTMEKPNIIILQMETFIDPTWVSGLEFSIDPIPNFRSLSEKYSSGLINVPTIGGGTANTEFEVITGMSLDYFSNGEYPYNTIMKKETIPTIAYSLKDIGYVSHGIHNHEGAFYDRYIVYGNMGFDTFTSIEHMSNYDINETGWVKDKILGTEISDILNSTEEKDFIYAVSVQGHGGYPSQDILKDKQVTILNEMDESIKNQWEYYVNQLYEMDKFIGDIIVEVENSDEPVIIVVFGDHLPGLGIEADELVTGNIYSTPYFIYDNLKLENNNEDLEAYQLSTKLLNLANIEGSIINVFHNSNKNSKSYQDDLKLLQYDMLYGEKYTYAKTGTQYDPADIKIGFRDIEVNGSEDIDKYVHILGNNFTINSKVFLNGEQVDTEWVNVNTIRINYVKLKKGDTLQVKQISRNGLVLGQSNIYIK